MTQDLISTNERLTDQSASDGSLADFVRLRGANLLTRTEPFFEWTDTRRDSDV